MLVPEHPLRAEVRMDMQRGEAWSRPEFEELGSGFEVSAYTNDWDDRI